MVSLLREMRLHGIMAFVLHICCDEYSYTMFPCRPVSEGVHLFGDTAAILNYIVSNSYYGMLRRQISMYLPPKHAIIAI